MNYFETPNPNNFDKANDFLETFKETHRVTEIDADSLLRLIVDFYFMKADGNPVSASIHWKEKVEPVLQRCDIREVAQD